MTKALIAIGLATCGLISSGCGGGEGTPAASPAPATSPATGAAAPRPPTGTLITLKPSNFGPMLFDTRRQAIYLFAKEKTSRPECYGECAQLWPPVYTKGTPRAGPGVRQALLGTTRRRDGRTQVTYGGHPLYFYANEGRGEVRCHDVFLNGGKWYVVQADGTRA